MFTLKYLFQLRDLQYDYPDSAFCSFQDKAFKDMPNNEPFNKFNKYEMVLLIAALQRQWRLSFKDDCKKIETLIREHLPPEIQSQMDVRDWLVLNWNSQLSVKSA